MAMQQIGIPARKVIADIEKMRAASIAQPARDLGDGPTGEETISPSTLFADAPAPSGSGIGLDERRGNSARPSSGAKVKEPSPNKRPVLRVLTGGRELRSDYRRRVEGFPDPALRNSLKLVGGTDHARSFSRTG